MQAARLSAAGQARRSRDDGRHCLAVTHAGEVAAELTCMTQRASLRSASAQATEAAFN
ncbi:hypothetical protein XAP412_410045 [Xanthomonas phaseoli pv. phaseoli]|uniref:Uncharacterized protein n=1 Tax=Xanthomonas campestris pv. phaseoli TaxID=317013 RepID=A0AB38E333_XANCH|nr:hypothetical protein XAP6984_460044 [Xanthomonas phaseoli pv. phaseoli]SON85214.1 hypothetical protein XAP412_410045 [Xanthomonas phaseoli pv. phaseoli]SON89724.1 hypothetical protein XAP7430_430044 [Xanthomonas phaseoli pv. phaseoli]